VIYSASDVLRCLFAPWVCVSLMSRRVAGSPEGFTRPILPLFPPPHGSDPVPGRPAPEPWWRGHGAPCWA
jgi:hypothetical protein